MSKNNDEQNTPLTVGGLSVKIDMVKEIMYDKKGKPIKDPQGEISYKREDYTGLMSLLNKFDSRLHDMKDLKMFLKVRDKLYSGWTKDQEQLELSLDEAAFLKKFLSEYKDKDGKDVPLKEFEARTLVGLLDALE